MSIERQCQTDLLYLWLLRELFPGAVSDDLALIISSRSELCKEVKSAEYTQPIMIRAAGFWVIVLHIILLYELPHDKINSMASAPSRDSDQPGHPPRLIRFFTVRMKKVSLAIH